MATEGVDNLLLAAHKPTPAASDYASRSSASALLRTLPHCVPAVTGNMQVQTALPTPLAMDCMLSHPRANAALEARAQYTVPFDLHAKPSWVSGPQTRDSKSAVADVQRRHTLVSGADSPHLVAKISVAERMPDGVRMAYQSLVEMGASVALTKSADMVFLPSVRNAGIVLDKPSTNEAVFPHLAVNLFHGTDECALQRLERYEHKPAPRQQSYRGDSNGSSFFNSEHSVAAMRLYVTVTDASVPYQMRFDSAKWKADMDAAFQALNFSAMRDGITPNSVLGSMRPPRAPRKFGHYRNGETINDVVGGARLTLLYNSRIAPNLTPLLDWFTVPLYAGEISAVYTIMPKNDERATDFFATRGGQCAPTTDSLALVRSTLAQVLFTLTAMQHRLRGVHYDLHIRNLMYAKVRSGMPERSGQNDVVWCYTLPNGDSLFIPAEDTEGNAARIIDAGRLRIDDPCAVGVDRRASFVELGSIAPCEAFDTGVDMRALANDLLMFPLNKWVQTLAAQHERVQAGVEAANDYAQQVGDLLEVLEAMANVQAWSEWCSESPETYVTNDNEPIPLPTTLIEHMSRLVAGNIDQSTSHRIRDYEFMAKRPDSEAMSKPSDVLRLRFFNTYRNQPEPAEGVRVIHVADANNPFKLQTDNGATSAGQVRKDREKQRAPMGSVEKH